MALYKSKNPALSNEVFTKAKIIDDTTEVMTINGTVNKTALLALIVLASSLITWDYFYTIEDITTTEPYFYGSIFIAFIIALIIIFIEKSAPYLSPIYCFFQGLVLGGISALMEARFPGIVLQAIVLTLSILFSLLAIYRSGIINVTKNFKLMISSAISGIGLYYLASFIGRFVGFELPFIHENTIGGILFSLFVVIIASLSLVVDFDFIEKGVESKSPKYMEWYAAFGLMVTIIWLYLEILRLLGKSRSRS